MKFVRKISQVEFNQLQSIPRSRFLSSLFQFFFVVQFFSERAQVGDPYDRPWLMRSERRRMFIHLPFEIFRSLTNIQELIKKEYSAKKQNTPFQTYLDRATEAYFERMKLPRGWFAPIFRELDFIIPKNEHKYVNIKFFFSNIFRKKTVLFFSKRALIWYYDAESREKIYATAIERQKKVVYLPLYIFKIATNARDLANSRKLENTANIDKMILNMFSKLHLIDSWMEMMIDLDFVPSTTKELQQMVMNLLFLIF